MAFQLTSLGVLAVRDRLAPAHRGHAMHGWELQRPLDLVRVDCGCGTQLALTLEVVVEMEQDLRAEEEDNVEIILGRDFLALTDEEQKKLVREATRPVCTFYGAPVPMQSLNGMHIPTGCPGCPGCEEAGRLLVAREPCGEAQAQSYVLADSAEEDTAPSANISASISRTITVNIDTMRDALPEVQAVVFRQLAVVICEAAITAAPVGWTTGDVKAALDDAFIEAAKPKPGPKPKPRPRPW